MPGERRDGHDELLGLGVLVKDLDAILELCKEVWPEGITCASSDLHGPGMSGAEQH